MIAHLATGPGLLAANDVIEPGGVSDRAHLLLVAVVVGALAFIIAGVRQAKVRSRYSLLWLVVVAALVPFAAFPSLLDRLAVRLGVAYPPALLLLLSVAVLFLLVVHLSWEVSRSDDRLRTLAEELALLRAELDERGHGTSPSPDGDVDAEDG